MSSAVYAGSFDPITNGHISVIKASLQIFDKVVIAVAINPTKKYMFSIDERIQMIREACLDIGTPDSLQFETIGNEFLVNWAASRGILFLIRGIRSVADYEYERTMSHLNSSIAPGVQTVVILPPKEYEDISSSTVKGMVGPKGWESHVKKFVPESTFKSLLKYSEIK